ncbi:unnamed protein product [Rotaria sp. Silwood2]|nr:unnamed protein product [Rotaria sp. Silwood2]
MRFMRERSDVICLHRRHHISASALNVPCLFSNDDNIDVTLDILLLPNEITVENLLEALESSFISKDGKVFFTENAINLVEAVKGVARCISGKVNYSKFMTHTSIYDYFPHIKLLFNFVVSHVIFISYWDKKNNTKTMFI